MKFLARDWRMWLLFGLSACAVAAVALHGPITQDPAYHRFADQRTIFGVPNFWNVFSNLGFVLVGLAGLMALRSGRTPGALPWLRRSYATFFSAAVLVGLGSGYYHLRPNDATLLWDRLPMTLAFMAFVSIVLGEHISAMFGRKALAALLGAGLLSILWWRVAGDLRAYALVQYLPGLLVPLVMLLFPSRLRPTGYLWGLLAAYVFAKSLELEDRPILRAIGISGHTLKHLAAAAGMSLLVVAIRRRRENRRPETSGGPVRPALARPLVTKATLDANSRNAIARTEPPARRERGML